MCFHGAAEVVGCQYSEGQMNKALLSAIAITFSISNGQAKAEISLTCGLIEAMGQHGSPGSSGYDRFQLEIDESRVFQNGYDRRVTNIKINDTEISFDAKGIEAKK